MPEPYENDENSKGKEGLNELTPSEEITSVPPEPPFPHTLSKPRKSNHSSKIYEIFKQVKVNIPLLDAIKQVPSYAKFIKDLCTVKRKLKVRKSALMAEQVSTILSTNNKLKYKDPGCPIISCIIGNHRIEHALLDLGASVNLLPYSVYLQLNLGELKSTSTTLLLADRSIKVPKGIVEDVLVQVDKFIYPVDFIVLETELVVNNYKPIPVILGRPFLATVNALINYRNGLMNLSFGNMTLELNVFNMCRQPNEENENEDDTDEQKELIESCIEENIQKGDFSKLSNVCLVNSIESNKKLELNISNINSLLDSVQTSQNYDDETKFEELGSIEKIEQQEAPKMELKPLPEGLKYAFLGEEQTYPVVISFILTSDQDDKLRTVLKKYKNAIGWTLNDIKGINPLICTHRINLEENAKTCQQPQRRLNPHMKEVVKTEVLKLFDVGIIYLISDSKWVSPTQVVPKKSGIIVVKNEKGKMPLQWNAQEKKKFFVEVKKFYWDNPYLFKYCQDQIFRRCIPDNENALRKIYKARCERLRLLMINGIPSDIRWLIEAKVRLAGEFSDPFVSYMPGFGKNTFAKKRRAKRLGSKCHTCVRLGCERPDCQSLGTVSDTREDKIKFIKDGMSKESLDDILRSLETHRSGFVQREIYNLWILFKKQSAQF
ncbi:hypothetical protein KPL70_023229 [Citrus sinensis]|nr:hypothetical protein KPL70_023229 [Citrus sinensis]